MKRKDPKREFPFEADTIAEKITETANEGTLLEEMYISRNTFVNMLWVSQKGAYVFVAFDDKDEIDLLLQAKEIKEYFPVNTEGLFIFFISEDRSYVVEKNMKGLRTVEDPLQAFETIVRNLSFPAAVIGNANRRSLDYLLTDHGTGEEVPEERINGMYYEHEGIILQIKDEEDADREERTYIRPVIDTATVQALEAICGKITGNGYPDANYRMDEDGNEYVLRDGDVMVKGFNTGLIGKKKWYRVSDRDPVRAFLMTVFGGWFGLHRLATGNIVSFLVYLLTCGFCGVFYILDVFQWVVGTASYSEVNYYEEGEETFAKPRLIREKSRVYYKKLPNKAMAFIGLAVSVFIFLIVFNLVYKTGYGALIRAFAEHSRNIELSPDGINNMVQGGEALTDFVKGDFIR